MLTAMQIWVQSQQWFINTYENGQGTPYQFVQTDQATAAQSGIVITFNQTQTNPNYRSYSNWNYWYDNSGHFYQIQVTISIILTFTDGSPMNLTDFQSEALWNLGYDLGLGGTTFSTSDLMNTAAPVTVQSPSTLNLYALYLLSKTTNYNTQPTSPVNLPANIPYTTAPSQTQTSTSTGSSTVQAQTNQTSGYQNTWALWQQGDPQKRPFATILVKYAAQNIAVGTLTFGVDVSLTYVNDATAYLDWLEFYNITVHLRNTPGGTDVAVSVTDSSHTRVNAGGQYTNSFSVTAPQPGQYFVALTWQTSNPSTTAYGLTINAGENSWDTASDPTRIPQVNLTAQAQTTIPVTSPQTTISQPPSSTTQPAATTTTTSFGMSSMSVLLVIALLIVVIIGLVVFAIRRGKGKISDTSASTRQVEVPPVQPTEKASKFCRKCGAQLIPSKKFCEKCGTPLASAEAPPPSTITTPPPPPGEFCGDCGARLSPDSEFCGECGARKS